MLDAEQIEYFQSEFLNQAPKKAVTNPPSEQSKQEGKQ
jgi:hypothetical protein